METDCQLQVSDLSKRYGRRWLFHGMSFDVQSGQRLGITGPNGSGKSTLLQILAGVLAPTSGSVSLLLNGVAVDDENRSLSMGFVAPYLQLYGGLTLLENLRFVNRLRGTENAPSGIAAAVDRVGLGGRGDDLVSTFSSGMLQRARLALALVVDPPVVLLDEPSSNLDDSGVALCAELVETWSANGRAVILATNSKAEVGWCERSLSVSDFSRRRNRGPQPSTEVP